MSFGKGGGRATDGSAMNMAQQGQRAESPPGNTLADTIQFCAALEHRLDAMLDRLNGLRSRLFGHPAGTANIGGGAGEHGTIVIGGAGGAECGEMGELERLRRQLIDVSRLADAIGMQVEMLERI